METSNGKTRVAVMDLQARKNTIGEYYGEHQIKSLRDFTIFGTVYCGSLRR